MSDPVKPLPLADIKVVELGTLIAGPYAGSLLAQFGAEIIKVEPPDGGDPLRTWRKLHKGTSLWWYAQSRNKKSITVNLKSDEGQAIVKKLVAGADVVIENFRPGALEGWKLGWEDLKAINPSLIMLRVSGYGQTGPYREKPGFAAIAESLGGLRYLTGFPDRPPVRTGVSIGDTLASLYGVVGILTAIHHQKVHGGPGQVIDLALYEAVSGVMESLIPEYAYSGVVRERTGASLPGITPSGTYACMNGEYVIIAGNADSIYKRLMRAIGRDDLADDPALARNDGRAAQNDRIDAAITAWTAHHEIDEVVRVLEAASVPCGKIYTAADIVADPHYHARGMIERFALPDGTPIDLPGIVPKLSETPGRTISVGPALGEHNAEVLAAIGFDGAAIAGLKQRGVI
jgi:formyl-CoA transferase